MCMLAKPPSPRAALRLRPLRGRSSAAARGAMLAALVLISTAAAVVRGAPGVASLGTGTRQFDRFLERTIIPALKSAANGARRQSLVAVNQHLANAVKEVLDVELYGCSLDIAAAVWENDLSRVYGGRLTEAGAVPYSTCMRPTYLGCTENNHVPCQEGGSVWNTAYVARVGWKNAMVWYTPAGYRARVTLPRGNVAGTLQATYNGVVSLCMRLMWPEHETAPFKLSEFAECLTTRFSVHAPLTGLRGALVVPAVPLGFGVAPAGYTVPEGHVIVDTRKLQHPVVEQLRMFPELPNDELLLIIGAPLDLNMLP